MKTLKVATVTVLSAAALGGTALAFSAPAQAAQSNQVNVQVNKTSAQPSQSVRADRPMTIREVTAYVHAVRVDSVDPAQARTDIAYLQQQRQQQSEQQPTVNRQVNESINIQR